MKSLLFFVLIIGGVVAWVYVEHPEIVAKLTSPETKKQIEEAISTAKSVNLKDQAAQMKSNFQTANDALSTANGGTNTAPH